MKYFIASILVVVLFVRDMLATAERDHANCDEARYSWILLSVVGFALIGALCVSGCAVMPIPLSPENEQSNSNTAEGAWLVLASVDTYQTMHIRAGTSCDHADTIAAALYGSPHPSPGRVLGTNVALMLGHTMVTSWLDDEVARHEMDDEAHPELPATVGPWYASRIAWHAVSVLVTGTSVIRNKQLGCG